MTRKRCVKLLMRHGIGRREVERRVDAFRYLCEEGGMRCTYRNAYEVVGLYCYCIGAWRKFSTCFDSMSVQVDVDWDR